MAVESGSRARDGESWIGDRNGLVGIAFVVAGGAETVLSGMAKFSSKAGSPSLRRTDRIQVESACRASAAVIPSCGAGGLAI
jgi:hypothetical protein